MLNPDAKRFTWRRYTNRGISQSRLDYFIISDGLSYYVDKCDIKPSFLSDHNPILLGFKSETKQTRGRGTWKFNSSLLRDNEYVKNMNELLDTQVNKYDKMADKGLAWDVIKSEIRGYTIGYSSYKSKQKKKLEQQLLTTMGKLEEKMDSNPSENIHLQLESTRKDLVLLEKERTAGYQIRAKCTHIENNEYNSKYFFSKERANAESKAMKLMILENGQEITEISQIGEEQVRFYKELYDDKTNLSKLETNEANKYFFNANVKLPQLEKDAKDTMDQPITPEELGNALQDLHNNKSPGIDGLPPEFYKIFWIKIKTIVCQSILHGIETGKMSVDQRRAVLTLLPKKDKDHRFIKNWRPLSLLNTDYKMLAKALATRLQASLEDLVHINQSGCIKGRSTFSNIRSTIDVINFANDNQKPGFIAFIDYEKAFDTVKWSLLFKTLKSMNFGGYFIGCIKTLYEDIGTHVSNYGFLSQQFKPARGIRQGCPISANLFILVVEILACAIRQNNRIKGIKIGDAEFKLSQYADDTCEIGRAHV
jgi:hypothetical protein